MAEFDNCDPADRYAEVEQAYCADDWTAVIEHGRQLLKDLSHSEAEDEVALRHRLQLLMGHANLYGFGDRNAAEDLYHAVLSSRAESSLRQIAEEGLKRCNLPLSAATQSLGEEGAPEGEPEVMAPAPVEPMAVASPEPAVGAAERPRPVAAELVEVPATPAREAPESHPLLTPAPFMTGAAGAVTAAAAGSAAAAMPWLKGEPGSGGTAVAGASGAAVATATARSPATSGAPGPEGRQPAAAGEAAPGEGAPQTGLPAQEAPEERAAASLIPEVVEEPELIEVHQADPSLAEELEVAVREGPAVEPESGDGEPAAAAQGLGSLPESTPRRPEPPREEDPDLLKGLLRVVLR